MPLETGASMAGGAAGGALRAYAQGEYGLSRKALLPALRKLPAVGKL